MSTSAPTEAPPSAPGALRLCDPALAAILVAAAALLAWSWARHEGYQLADSVEYLERAQGIAHGHALIDSQAIRSFGFSGLLVPLYWIYGALSLDEPVWIVRTAQLLQVALTLALVAATARLAARFAGRAGGLAAAALLALNPIVWRWGVEPVSGVAAALFVVLAASRALRGRSAPFASAPEATAPEPHPRARDAWICGLWLGLAFLMAYQAMLVVAAMLCVILVRDLRRRPAWVLQLAAALALVVLAQCLLDRAYYGTFGISVSTYLVENFGSNAARLLHKGGALPVVGPLFYDAAEWLYNTAFPPTELTHAYQDQVVAGAQKIQQNRPFSWYLANLARCLVAPAALLVALGLARSLLRAPRATALLWFVVLANVLVMSTKGSKDFRLWLPFLPLVAALGGIGVALLHPRGALARFACGAALAAALVLGILEFQRTNTRKYGGFWRAIEYVNGRAAERPPADGEGLPRLRLSAAYHWSMFLRESRDVELVKLPHHLDGWMSYDAEARARDFDTLATLDAFITHLPVLTKHPELFEVLNRDFAVSAAFYDRVAYDALGPIYVLERRSSPESGRAFFRRADGVPLSEAAARAGHGPLLSFERATDAGAERLALVDARYMPLPGDGHGWITYTWHGGPLPGPDWRFLDRLTAPDYENSWQNNHAPAYGMAPTSTWGADTLIEEGFLVVAEAEPFLAGPVYRRFGGGYRRGDLLPLTLWIDVVRFDDAAGVRTDRLPALDPATREEVARAAPAPSWTTPSGATTLADGMTRAASMLVPVHPAARLPDDGRPVLLAEQR